MHDLEINNSVFENIKHIDKEGNEYWSARELSKVLEYSEYRKFLPAIEKAIISCQTSNQRSEYHFAQSGGMIDIGKGGKRKVTDYKLSRYACYLIVQNANQAHYNMGRDIRNFIKKQGGTMSEDLKTPKKSLKELEKTKPKLLR